MESEREIRLKWYHSLPLEGKEDIFFEFEHTLTALSRFFHPQNHPPPLKTHATYESNVKNELEILDRSLRRLIHLIETILRAIPGKDFFFQSYVETHLIKDTERELLLTARLQQTNPTESLYLLYLGLRSLVPITQSLLHLQTVRLPAFLALGQQYTFTLVTNHFFNPIKLRGFSPLYDRITNPVLGEIIQSLPEGDQKLQWAYAILSLLRYLRIVRFTHPSRKGKEELSDTLLWFSYLQSEINTFISYLEDRKKVYPVFDALSFQLSLDSRKVFHQILKGFTYSDREMILRTKVDSAHGVMKNFLEQAVLLLIETIHPHISGSDIFPEFKSKKEQSLRLREDLWVFHEILKNIIPILEDENQEPLTKRAMYHALLEFIQYFEGLSMNFVRYTDYESFQNFFEEIRGFKGETFISEARSREIAKTMENFRIFLETTFSLVNQRAELNGIPVDIPSATSTLKKFLPEIPLSSSPKPHETSH
jgi:hypothetical protein